MGNFNYKRWRGLSYLVLFYFFEEWGGNNSFLASLTALSNDLGGSTKNLYSRFHTITRTCSSYIYYYASSNYQLHIYFYKLIVHQYSFSKYSFVVLQLYYCLKFWNYMLFWLTDHSTILPLWRYCLHVVCKCQQRVKRSDYNGKVN